MDCKGDHNVFVGGKLGTLKGVKLEIKNGTWLGIAKNLRKLDNLKKEEEITALSWGDAEQREVLIGHADQSVKVYDTSYGAYASSFKASCGQGRICGIARSNGNIVVGVTSGHISICNANNKQILEVKGPLEKMKLSPHTESVVATGGKDRDLQLWDLEKETCIFSAKNVRNDSLELQVPVWVSDIAFPPDSSKVVICSRHGHVRVYDPSHQRRPVLNYKVPEKSLTACSVTHDGNYIVMGASDGYMGAFDLRKGCPNHRFKAAVGSVRSIVCHPQEPLIFSVGLDRFMRVHHFEKRKLLLQDFLKTRLNCLLVRDDFFSKESKEQHPKDEDSEGDIVDLSEEENSEKVEARAYNKLFDEMEAITEEPKLKKLKKKS